MSSLKALVLDPEDNIGKQIMAQVSIKKKTHEKKNYFSSIFIFKHLHAVLHNDDDKQSMAAMESELEEFNIASLSHDNITGTTSSGKNKDFCVKN